MLASTCNNNSNSSTLKAVFPQLIVDFYRIIDETSPTSTDNKRTLNAVCGGLARLFVSAASYNQPGLDYNQILKRILDLTPLREVADYAVEYYPIVLLVHKFGCRMEAGLVPRLLEICAHVLVITTSSDKMLDLDDDDVELRLKLDETRQLAIGYIRSLQNSCRSLDEFETVLGRLDKLAIDSIRHALLN